MRRKKDRLVVITGAGSGIGAALAGEAARAGARLILAGRRKEALEETAAHLPASSEPILVQADITRAEGRTAIAEAVAGAGGKLDILINNAGAVRTGSIAGMTEAAVMEMLQTNLAAPLLLSRDLLPFLKRAAAPRIVNVGSMFGDIAFPLFAAYSATKFGLRGLSDALRRELAPDGVGVTYAAPRAVRTPAAQSFEELVEPFGMKLDDPAKVARRIWRAAEKQKRSVYPAGPERFFVLLQRLLPGAVDGGLIKQFTAYRGAAAGGDEREARVS
ncbi:SDR family NAD(P)-dependent oxidoreductase [Tepidicaulis sp.]|uniref:SDR family NAD(P)-dependent oxidoreductase n=1 Tax=Tepidicaulis sp. TaxID=1920809 RepID=UPI003B5C990F